MAQWNPVVLTTVGITLINELIATDVAMTASKLELSSQSYSVSSLAGLTSLSGVQQTSTTGLNINGNVLQLVGQVDNSTVTTAYTINTIGFYVKDTDGTTDVLLAVLSAITPDTMPDNTSMPTSLRYSQFITLDTTTPLTVNASFAGYISDAEFETYKAQIENAVNGSIASGAYDESTTTIQLTTSGGTVINVPIGLASETVNGDMPKESFSAINTLNAFMQNIQGTQIVRAGQVNYTSSDWSALTDAQRQSAFTTAFPTLTSFTTTQYEVVTTDGAVWFSRLASDSSTPPPWVLWTSPGGVSAPLATNSSTGTVTGKTTGVLDVSLGKIFVENDNTMTMQGNTVLWQSLFQNPIIVLNKGLDTTPNYLNLGNLLNAILPGPVGNYNGGASFSSITNFTTYFNSISSTPNTSYTWTLLGTDNLSTVTFSTDSSGQISTATTITQNNLIKNKPIRYKALSDTSGSLNNIFSWDLDQQSSTCSGYFSLPYATSVTDTPFGTYTSPFIIKVTQTGSGRYNQDFYSVGTDRQFYYTRTFSASATSNGVPTSSATITSSDWVCVYDTNKPAPVVGGGPGLSTFTSYKIGAFIRGGK